MKRIIAFVLILTMLLIPLVAAGEHGFEVQTTTSPKETLSEVEPTAATFTEGTTIKGDTKVVMDKGKVEFTDTSSGLSAATDIKIDGVAFVPAKTKTAETLVWSTGEVDKDGKDDPIVKMEYSYNGKTLKEVVTLKEDKVLSFPITLDKDSKLIPWDNGQWKIVSTTSGDTMRGIILEKPYGIDANGDRIEMEYKYTGGNLDLIYNRVIIKHEKAEGNESYTDVEYPIVYPLTIDPTWTAVGGSWEDTTTYPGYVVVKWNATGTTSWSPPSGVTKVDYLIVAGGGGGGHTYGGGGGAGEVKNGTGKTVSGATTVTVGLGGAGAANRSDKGTGGGNSVFSDVTANGGGGGGSYSSTAGANGGSGGGGAGTGSPAGGTKTATGYGNNGGSGASNYYGGGGGGAGSVGINGGTPADHAGNGGDGIDIFKNVFAISENNGFLAGGGGGGSRFSGEEGSGGSGVGGNGAPQTGDIAGSPGIVNTGSGGGGGRDSASNAVAAGGTGVVYIKYLAPSSYAAMFASNISIGYQYPLVVKFTDTSAGSPTTWNWTFGDTYTSTTQNPVHIYSPAGNYTVSLNATYLDGLFSVNTSYVELKTDDDIWLKSWMQFENASVVDLKGVAWTAAGGAATTAAQQKFGAQSLDVTSNDARVSTVSSSRWDWGGSDAEMEFWIRPVTIVADKNLISRTTGTGAGTATGWGLRSNASGTGYYWWMGTTATKTPNFTLTLNAWTHIKIERDDASVEIYKNGVIESDTNMPGVFDTANPVYIGQTSGGADNTFYVDEFRFTNGISREVGEFPVPYAAYRGNLYVNYININPNATLRYKTDPSFPSNAIVFNQTGARNRTVQVQNLTNATYITATTNFETGSMFAQGVHLNKSTYADTVLESYSIDNVNGIVEFNVSRALGIQAPGNTRVSLVDIPMLYYKYSTDTDVYTFFGSGDFIDTEHNVGYPIFNFIGTNVTLGTWGTPIINFAADDTTPAIYQTVTFTDATLNYPDAYAWDFGDGSTSTVKNPTHAYSSIGQFNVTLHAYLAANTSVTNTSTKTFYINTTAVPPPAPVAAFSGAPTNVALGNPVTFTDASTNTPTSWLWDFGDSSGSALQNPTHVYTANGNYTVNLTATNPTGSDLESKFEYIHVTAIGGSGYNQQDLVMTPEYVFTATIVDSVTHAPIPVVGVLDSTGYNVTTSTGVFSHTYPYSVVVLYLSSTGYMGKTASYIVDSDRSVTIEMVEASPEPVTNTWWTPHTVQINLFDTQGTKLQGVLVNAYYNESSMPESWATELYGIRSGPAAQMYDATLLMSGTTGGDGTVTFTMLGSLRYDVYLTSAAYGLSNYHVSVFPSDAVINIYVPTVTGSLIPTSQNSTYTALNQTRVYFTEPNMSYVSMCIDYKDASGMTTSVTNTWYFTNNNTIMNTSTFSPGTSLVTQCHTIPNTRGTSVFWKWNATRSE